MNSILSNLELVLKKMSNFKWRVVSLTEEYKLLSGAF